MSRAAFKACLRKKISQGHDRDSAEAQCRHMAVANSEPATSIPTTQITLEGESDGLKAALATLAVIDSMRPRTEIDRAAEATLAKITAMHTTEPDAQEKAALATLQKIFGESTLWAGYSAPVATKTTAAPEIGNLRGQPGTDNQPAFPFASETAKKVWDYAQYLVLLNPLDQPGEILVKAMEQAGIQTTELPPEDDELLKMAIDYLQNGPARSNVRLGGTPGGPFRASGRDPSR